MTTSEQSGHDDRSESKSNDKAALKSETESNASKKPVPRSPRPPRGPRLWVMFLVALGLIAGFVGGNRWGPAVMSRARDLIAQSAPGAASESDKGAPEDKPLQYYTCGMHPWVILPKPGLCPICHMDLIPLDPAKFTGKISIDPVVTQNIGVRIEPVTAGPVVRTIRTVGTIAYDETRVRDVNIKVPGWIETLYVDYEGAAVQAGVPLFDYYSPQLYSAQSEYLSVLRTRDTLNANRLPELQMDMQRLIDDARTQLEFYDVTAGEIRALEERGEASKAMTITSPFTGIVIAKHANEGMRVDPGMRVFQIADLSKVWVMVSLYEYQLPFVEEGQTARMSLPYIPGQSFEGKVIYLYPYLNEKTRQVSVRLEFDNPNLLLKPGMFASVELKNTVARQRTLVPRSAVIDTGQRSVSFVSLGEGRFEPRDVMLGAEADDGLVEILDGLNVGEMVVTSGQFLLDSEARIRESLAKMISGNLAGDQKPSVHVEGASELSALPSAVEEGINRLLDSYFIIGDRLAGDSIEGVASPAQEVASTVDQLLKVEIPGQAHFWHQHDEVATIRGKALEIASAADLETIRLAFADLSVAMIKLVGSTGVPASYEFEVQRLHCPMYRAGQGGSIWLQRAGDVRNPFYGSVMIECFDQRTAMPVTGGGPTADDPVEGIEP